MAAADDKGDLIIPCHVKDEPGAYVKIPPPEKMHGVHHAREEPDLSEAVEPPHEHGREGSGNEVGKAEEEGERIEGWHVLERRMKR